MIKLEKVNLEFDEDHKVFKDLDLTINDGETVGIIGHSGSGKSTLLRCIMLLRDINSGRITLDGEELTASNADKSEFRKRIGMVFQDFNLFDHMTVLENVMSGLVDLKDMPFDEAYLEAMKYIKFVGLADKSMALPKNISGGQKQRAAIARTIAMQPEIVLMDEPTSSLDPIAKGEVQTVIGMMSREGHTMIISSHEIELLRSTCSRVVFLCDGGVYEDGTPEEIFDNPKRDKTRQFVQALRVFEVDVTSDDFDFIGLQTSLLDYAVRNCIDTRLLYRLQSVLEELFSMKIIGRKNDNKMHISIEYSYKSKSVRGVCLCSGSEIDPDAPEYYISWPIIKKRTDDIFLEKIDEDGYTNRIIFTME